VANVLREDLMITVTSPTQKSKMKFNNFWKTNKLNQVFKPKNRNQETKIVQINLEYLGRRLEFQPQRNFRVWSRAKQGWIH
jgi:hypothetical protein